MDILKKYEQYIKGQLSEEQLESFTKDIVKDHMEAEALKKKWAGLLEDDQDFLKLREEIQKQEQPTATVKKMEPKWNFRRLLSIAATLLLLVAAGFFLFNSNSDIQTLASNQLEKPYAYQDSRGGSTEGVDLRIDASDRYRAGNYKAAIPLFEQLLQTSARENSDRFYLGLSYLFAENYDQAISTLEELKTVANIDLTKETSWYLGLALIKAGQLEKAQVELKTLAEGNGWKSKEAKELLEGMK